MKRLLNKFKKWLVHKLGGIYIHDVIRTKVSELKPIPIGVSVYIEKECQLRWFENPVGYQTFVKKELANQLAKCLMENEILYDVYRQEDDLTESVVYTAKMLVCEKGGAE